MSASSPLHSATFAIELGGGHRLIGDHLSGASPGYVFLHGLGSVRAGEKSASLFAHAHARGLCCTRFDFRGHGDSSGVIGQVKMSELVADARRVFERFGPANLVGSSLGGVVGALLAAGSPQLVTGMALLAPALGFLSHLDRFVDAAGQLHTRDGRQFPMAAEVLADALALDEASLPVSLPMPVLLVHGTADDVVPHATSQAFHDAIPHARKDLWIVPSGDHRLAAQAGEIWRRLDRLLAAGA